MTSTIDALIAAGFVFAAFSLGILLGILIGVVNHDR